jgi:GPH family glycoside/pentoside/hexuronide:cation symporter
MTELKMPVGGVDVMTTQTATDRVPTGVKIAYGAVEGAFMIWWTAIAIFYLIFLTDVAGLDPSLAGMVLSVAVIWNAIADLAMGIISDRTRSRYGRRRPYMLISLLPICVMLWLIFTVPPLEGAARIGYFVVTMLIMHTASTVIYVPYNSMGAEMTTDYDERTSIVSYRVVWSNVGLMLASALPPVLASQFTDLRIGWSVTGGVLGMCCFLPILLAWRFTRGWERVVVDTEQIRIRDIFDAIFGNRTFRYILATFSLTFIGIYAASAMVVYFMTYCMEFSEKQITGYFLVFSFSSVLLIPVVLFVANKLGKRNAFILIMSIASICSAIGLMLAKPGQVLFMYSLGCVNALWSVCSYQLMYAMLPDVVEVDEFKTGKRREGLYFGVFLFVMKLASALSLFCLGQILGLVGYVPNVAQNESALLWIRVMAGPMISGLYLISCFIILFMPMTRDRHKALLRAIEAKRAGEKWDEESISKLM